MPFTLAQIRQIARYPQIKQNFINFFNGNENAVFLMDAMDYRRNPTLPVATLLNVNYIQGGPGNLYLQHLMVAAIGTALAAATAAGVADPHVFDTAVTEALATLNNNLLVGGLDHTVQPFLNQNRITG